MSRKGDKELLKVLEEHLLRVPHHAKEPQALAALCIGAAGAQSRPELVKILSLISGIPA